MSNPPSERTLKLRDLILMGQEPKEIAYSMGETLRWVYWVIANLKFRRRFVTDAEWREILERRGHCKTRSTNS